MSRAPLVVLPEASFPPHVAAPWLPRAAGPASPLPAGKLDVENEISVGGGAVYIDGREAGAGPGLGPEPDVTATRGARLDTVYPYTLAAAAATVPTAVLPLPLVPLDPTSSSSSSSISSSTSTAGRDTDSEVGALADTLRALGMVSGDLVEITAPLAGATRVARLVAADRHLEAGAGGHREPSKSLNLLLLLRRASVRESEREIDLPRV